MLLSVYLPRLASFKKKIMSLKNMFNNKGSSIDRSLWYIGCNFSLISKGQARSKEFLRAGEVSTN